MRSRPTFRRWALQLTKRATSRRPFLDTSSRNPNTGSHTYTFELSARRGAIGARSADTFFKIVFRYPREEAAAAQAAATQAAYTRAVALQAGAIRSALDLAVLEGKRNLQYSVQTT